MYPSCETKCIDSIIGSRQSIDEMHPKALNELEQRYKRGDSRSPGHQRSNLVINSTNKLENANFHLDNCDSEDVGKDHYRSKASADDDFDQHIEEMMRVILAQGKMIHDQLQRFNDRNNSLKPSPKVKVQAQIHTPLSSSHKESDSATSSNYDSTSTSTSTSAPKRNERSTRSNKIGTIRKFQQADFVRHPNQNSSNIHLSGSPAGRAGIISQRTSSLGPRSKSYDNYETIFPLSRSPNTNFEGNASVDHLPTEKTVLGDESPKHVICSEKSSSSIAVNSAMHFTNSNKQMATTPYTPLITGQPSASSSQSSIPHASISAAKDSTSMDSTSDAHKNITMNQSNNSDFQIVDITNVPYFQKDYESKPSSDNINNISFTSSSASEAAGGNAQLCIRSSRGNEPLNQSFDLMNISVMNSSPSTHSNFPFNPKPTQGNVGSTEGSSSNIIDVQNTGEAGIRLQRDKLILKTIHNELTKLVQMNDRLTFAEDSVDRLKIAIRQVQDKHQHQTDQEESETNLNDAPNLRMSEQEAEEHIASAREQLERLKVANDDASKVIEKNRGNIEDMDKKMKEGKAKLKHLEYDVNVIEKESRKLNKELEKVLSLEVGGNEIDKTNDTEITIQDDKTPTNNCSRPEADVTSTSNSLDVSVCTEDVTIMTRINGSVDNSNPEDSVDSSTMFPELLHLDRNVGNELKNESNISQSNTNSTNQTLQVKQGSLAPLLPLTTDISVAPRTGCYEDIRMAINGSPAGSGASSSGNSSDKSVRFSDTEIIHPHHEYTTSSMSLTPDLPDLPDEPASRGSYTTAIKNGCNSSIMSLLAKSAANNSSLNKPILKSQRSSDGKTVTGAGANVDVDTDNSDTGLSSLHSSSDEATFDAGTLV